MPNLTLAIDKETQAKMKEFSEVKWSEFVRKSIRDYIEKLESIENHESLVSTLASEESLHNVWDNTHDERWNDV